MGVGSTFTFPLPLDGHSHELPRAARPATRHTRPPAQPIENEEGPLAPTHAFA
jgi:hypothetical protein